MREATDLGISAGVRRELSGRRIDLSKLKFPVKAGVVTLQGEFCFVDAEKTTDETAIELKFIESSLRSLPGVKDILVDLTNWKRSDTGAWDPIGGSATSSDSYAPTIKGDGITCSGCDYVIRFCPCCGKPLSETGSATHARRSVTATRPVVRPRKSVVPPVKPRPVMPKPAVKAVISHTDEVTSEKPVTKLATPTVTAPKKPEVQSAAPVLPTPASKPAVPAPAEPAVPVTPRPVVAPDQPVAPAPVHPEIPPHQPARPTMPEPEVPAVPPAIPATPEPEVPAVPPATPVTPEPEVPAVPPAEPQPEIPAPVPVAPAPQPETPVAPPPPEAPVPHNAEFDLSSLELPVSTPPQQPVAPSMPSAPITPAHEQDTALPEINFDDLLGSPQQEPLSTTEPKPQPEAPPFDLGSLDGLGDDMPPTPQQPTAPVLPAAPADLPPLAPGFTDEQSSQPVPDLDLSDFAQETPAPLPSAAQPEIPALDLPAFDDDIPLPPMKPKAPAFPDLADDDDDTPLPPMKPASPPPAAKPATSDPFAALFSDSDLPAPPRSTAESKDPFASLDLDILEIFPTEPDIAPSPAAPAAPPKPQAPADDNPFNFDNVIDLDLPIEDEKPKKKPAKDPFNLDDFDLTKF